jgi:murein DD-endopeptidase MepM/ murein hydrolase activator NlpD
MPPLPSTSATTDPVRRAIALGAAVVLCVTAISGPASASEPRSRTASEASAGAGDLAERRWIWPADAFRLSRPYVAPAHEYGPGHRGIDLGLIGSTAVRSPADGVVAFTGTVAGRGVLTIDHGDGLVTTLEPIETELVPGASIRRGDEVGALALGGHVAPGDLHFGVRLDGAYINPLLLLGGVPRAVLLPCCV